MVFYGCRPNHRLLLNSNPDFIIYAVLEPKLQATWTQGQELDEN